MDRTLINTPDFTHFIDVENNSTIDTDKYFPEQFKAIKAIFWNILMTEVHFKKEGDYAVIINSKNNSRFDERQLSHIFSKDPKAEQYLELHNDEIVVKHPRDFYTNPQTLGYAVNDEITKEYESANHKMILTGRGEKLRADILKMFKFLNVPEPNEGLVLWPGSPKIKEYKTNKILDAAATGKWNEIHFFEDREDWLSHAHVAMNSTYPNIKFVPHLITTYNT